MENYRVHDRPLSTRHGAIQSGEIYFAETRYGQRGIIRIGEIGSSNETYLIRWNSHPFYRVEKPAVTSMSAELRLFENFFVCLVPQSFSISA